MPLDPYVTPTEPALNFPANFVKTVGPVLAHGGLTVNGVTAPPSVFASTVKPGTPCYSGSGIFFIFPTNGRFRYFSA